TTSNTCWPRCRVASSAPATDTERGPVQGRRDTSRTLANTATAQSLAYPGGDPITRPDPDSVASHRLYVPEPMTATGNPGRGSAGIAATSTPPAIDAASAEDCQPDSGSRLVRRIVIVEFRGAGRRSSLLARVRWRVSVLRGSGIDGLWVRMVVGARPPAEWTGGD